MPAHWGENASVRGTECWGGREGGRERRREYTLKRILQIANYTKDLKMYENLLCTITTCK